MVDTKTIYANFVFSFVFFAVSHPNAKKCMEHFKSLIVPRNKTKQNKTKQNTKKKIKKELK